MDYSTPGFPDPHHLLEFAQVHVHCINTLEDINSFMFLNKSLPKVG